MSEESAVRAWREVLARHASVTCALERELSDKYDLGVSEFEVLERMVEGDQEKYRSQEIAAAVHLSQSACSRVIARLEKAGLVRRAICEADRRGVFVVITEEGRARHAAALPAHRAVVVAAFDSGASPPPPCALEAVHAAETAHAPETARTS
ncbi:MarR family winged helix-turn-helix transcriptional regulator [Planomonospora sp. ID67723]|uniref:MarR family winged helix-turn-helix transcriptional regulator n=1 Tax=Planomonospora sp. ID67723 TaxID=2738134 RepID=UPI001E335D03|nr:MarR family transcriptional regulator [Planomonospora sp. ID67723]